MVGNFVSLRAEDVDGKIYEYDAYELYIHRYTNNHSVRIYWKI